MNKFILLFLFFSSFCSAQVSKYIDKKVCEYENIISNFSPIRNDLTEKEIDKFELKTEKLKSIISKKISNKEIEEIYKGKYGYYSKRLMKVLLFQRKDSLTLIKLFKETVHLQDRCLTTEDNELYNSELGGFMLLNSELFEELTMKPNDSIINKSSRLKEELLEYIFSTKPINIQLLKNIQYQIPLLEKYYLEIKNLVENNGEKDFLPYLKSYKLYKKLLSESNF